MTSLIKNWTILQNWYAPRLVRGSSKNSHRAFVALACGTTVIEVDHDKRAVPYGSNMLGSGKSGRLRRS